jgi:hypothetical protein
MLIAPEPLELLTLSDWLLLSVIFTCTVCKGAESVGVLDSDVLDSDVLVDVVEEDEDEEASLNASP